MLVLAIDTATPAVTAGLVALTQPSGDAHVHVLARRVTVDARAHSELLTSHVMDCLQAAGRRAADLDAIVVGVGPGPFTGLRVGLATAAAFGDALTVPVHGVCSLDAIALEAWPQVSGGELVVVTDARRREVYWAHYRRSSAATSEVGRVAGPAVCRPADVAVRAAPVVAGIGVPAGLFDVAAAAECAPPPGALVQCAAPQLLSGMVPTPAEPRYLRRPDAVEPVRR